MYIVKPLFFLEPRSDSLSVISISIVVNAYKDV